MPDNGIYSWSATTPLNNGNADSTINQLENMAPSQVNNSARAEMSRHAQRLIDTGYPTAGGSADALTLTPLNVLTSYTSGMVYTFTAASTNTTNATLNISGVGIKAIRKISGGVDVALTAGDIAAASRYQVVYDSTANAAAGAWVLLNPAGAFAADLAAYLKLAGNQTVTGGFELTSYSAGTKSSGTFTPDPINQNYQYYTNGGAHTLAAPASDCAIDILVTNNGSAGSITFSGFTVASGNTGDPLTTTNGHKFLISIRRMNSVSTYIIKALQ